MAGHTIESEVKELLREIKDRARKVTRVINVLLVGQTGVGKSSLINSLIMAIDQSRMRCGEFAKKGFYGEGGYKEGGSFTKSLRFYDAYALTEDKSFEPPVRFWDFPGLPDSTDEITSAIFTLLMDGCIAVNSSYEELRALGMSGLKKLEKEQNASRVINVVVFVHAANDYVAENLVEKLEKQPRKPERDIPVFLVITKMDTTLDEDVRKFLIKTKGTLVSALGLEGVEEKVFEITNYTSVTTSRLRRKQSLDRELLEFWAVIVDPVHNDTRLPVPDVSRGKCVIL